MNCSHPPLTQILRSPRRLGTYSDPPSPPPKSPDVFLESKYFISFFLFLLITSGLKDWDEEKILVETLTHAHWFNFIFGGLHSKKRKFVFFKSGGLTQIYFI